MSALRTDSAPEDIEGLDEDADASLGEYPIDTMLIRHEPRTVHEVLRRIDKRNYVMDPDFQRDFIWPEDKQSKLIESVLMRIPLPVFYLAEDDQGRMVVVDGLQRLSTLHRFVNNQLRLKLPKQAALNKLRFQDLSPKLQNRIEDCTLILYIIDAKVPERACLDIFERVNSGEPLTRQQMRNSLFMGQATRFLEQEANTELFLNATGKSLSHKMMRDREFVNRFCAFYLLPLSEYRGDMDDFLALALTKMNTLDQETLTQLSAEFRNTLANNFELFGKHAFRRNTATQDTRSVINASLWDVMTTGLVQPADYAVRAHADKLKAAFYQLMDNGEFMDAITSGSNDVKKVKTRFTLAGAMFQEVFGANPD